MHSIDQAQTAKPKSFALLHATRQVVSFDCARGLLLAACALLANASAAAELATSAPVVRVTLFQGNASVERLVKVPAGARVVELECVPGNFDESTLRVEPQHGVRTGLVSVRLMEGAEAERCQLAELSKRSAALTEQMAQIKAQADSQSLGSTLLESISKLGGRPGAVAGSVAGPVARASDQVNADMDALMRSADVLYAARRATQQRSEEVLKQWNSLRKQVEQRAANRGGERAIKIGVAAPAAGALRLSYQVARAGWTPRYVAHLDSAQGTVQIERQAMVAQLTGEDWSGVELRMSTGRPNLSPAAADPKNWVLSVFDPQLEASSYRQDAFGAVHDAAKNATMSVSVGPTSASRAVEPPLFPIDTTEGAFVTEFRAPLPMDIASDGQRVSVSIERLSLPVKLVARAVPRVEPFAYLVARGEPLQGIWLSGQVQLLRDGQVVGTMQWVPGQAKPLTLSFGRDARIRVVAETDDRYNASAGFIGSRTEMRIGRRYTVGPAKPLRPAQMLTLRRESCWWFPLNSNSSEANFWGI